MNTQKGKIAACAGFIISGLMLPQASIEAAIAGIALGTGAPPSTLGGYAMTAFPVDSTNPVYPSSFLDVTAVPGPGGSSLSFNQPLTHDRAGDINTGWATWSHGYVGDVYDTISASDPNSVTLTLSGSAHAFYFYAEPTEFTENGFTITATTKNGEGIVNVIQTVKGQGGAAGYGFFTDSFITSIKIDGPGTDFAIGEFGISAVPEPTTFIAGTFALLLGAFPGFRCLRRPQDK